MTPPPSEWKERKDFDTRKIIEHVDTWAKKLDGRIQSTDADVLDLRRSINRRFKHKVGYPGLIALLVAVGTAVAAFSVNAANTARKELSEARSQLAADALQVRTETADRLNRFGAALDAVKDVVVEGKARREAQEEFKRKTRE
jgi:hypothetical protein